MPGFSSNISGLDVVFAKNVSFSGSLTNADTMLTDGQLLIASTALNAGGTHINVGTLTSPNGTITIGFSSPNITIDLVGGKQSVETLSDDVNTIVTPTANNIQLVGHVVEAGATKFSTVVAGTHLLNINPMSSSRWIVDPLGFNGTHTTIASAITSATSGDTIFILPGTYTENLTLKAGVNLTTYDGESSLNGSAAQFNVTIVGKATGTFSGSCNISNICLQTNSDFLLVLSGSNPTSVTLNNCYINALNNTAISITSSGSPGLQMNNCQGRLGTTGIAFFSATSGSIRLYGGIYFNSGSTTANSFSNAVFEMEYVNFNSVITTTNASGLTFNYCTIGVSGTIAVTLAGTSTLIDVSSAYTSGTASAISIGTGCSVNLANSKISSSNTNALTGLGSITYSAIDFLSSSSANNVTTQNTGTFNPGTLLLPGQGTAFTPVLKFGGATTGITYATQIGEYTQIGNVVFFYINIQLSSKGSATGAVTITGLPVTTNGNNQVFPVGYWSLLTLTALYTYVGAYNNASSTTIVLIQSGSAQATVGLADTNFANTSAIIFNGYYFTT